MYRLLQGHSLTVTASNPVIDASLDDSGETARISKFFQEAYIGNLLRPGSREQTAAMPSSSSRQQDTTAQAAARTPAYGGSKAKFDQVKSSSNTVRSFPLEDLSPHDSSEGYSDTVSSAMPLTGGPTAARNGQPPAPVRLTGVTARLTKADADVDFSAELRAPRVLVYVADGTLLLPTEVRWVMYNWGGVGHSCHQLGYSSQATAHMHLGVCLQGRCCA